MEGRDSLELAAGVGDGADVAPTGLTCLNYSPADCSLLLWGRRPVAVVARDEGRLPNRPLVHARARAR